MMLCTICQITLFTLHSNCLIDETTRFLQVKTFIDFPDGADMEDILICQDTWGGKSKVVYTVVASVAQFFVPVILVIGLYLSIYLKLKNRPQVSPMYTFLRGNVEK